MKTIEIEHPVITIPVSVIVREVDSSLPEYKDLFPGMPEPFKDVVIKEGIPFENIDLTAMWGKVMAKDVDNYFEEDKVNSIEDPVDNIVEEKDTFKEIIEELKLLAKQCDIEIATPYCFPDEDIQYLEDSNKLYDFLHSDNVINDRDFPFSVWGGVLCMENFKNLSFTIKGYPSKRNTGVFTFRR